MKLTQTAPITTIDRPAPATFICAPQPKIWEDATAEAQPGDIIRKPFCPIARVVGKENLKDGRVCLVVTFPGCHDRHVEEWVLPAAEVTAVTAPAPAVTRAPSKPAAASHAATTAATTAAVIPAPIAPSAIGTNDEPPNRGDNGRGRVQPSAAKKLLPSLVSVKRISSDIPASNFDQFELEVLGELSLAIGGFLVPPVLVRHSGGYKVVSGHLQYHAAVLAKQLNPRAGENIPAIVLEEENQAAALNQLKRLKFAA
jgi:hypothetical protein